MKTSLLFSLLIALTFKMFPQSIPNGGFENWNVTSYNDLMYWYCSNENNNGNPVNVTRVTDPYHGSYAALLSTVMTGTNLNFAFIANGDPSKVAGQGVPYNQQATGFSFRYKCNIVTNDSAFVWVIFKKSGVKIGEYIKKITGTKTNYTLGSMTFSLSQAPDSMIFAAASSNPFSYTGPAGSTFQLDSLLFTGVSGQPVNFNGSFEQWQMISSATPLGWNTSSNNSATQTNDMYSGNYALRLQTMSSGTVAYPGNATNGTPASSTTIGGTPFSNQIDTLVFYYKYAPANSNDSAMVNLNFKKNFNFFSSYSAWFPAAGSYTKAKMPINLSMAPDSLIIFLNSSKSWTVPGTYGGADFKIDNMYMTSQVVPVTDFIMTNACVSQNFQAMDNSSNLPTAYSWTLAGATPSTSTLQNPLVIYNSPGTYTIIHSTSNSFGNGSIVTKTISVNPTPTLSVTGLNTICSGNSVVLNVTGASTYTWMAGPNTSTISVTPTITASYSVAGTTAGCMGYAYMTVTVNPNPTVTAVSNTSLVCIGQSATLTANGGTSYTWTPGGVAASIVISPTTTGTYSLIGKDVNGCTNTTMLTQSVSACAGVNELTGNNTGLIVYPNPNNGAFTIKSKTEDVIALINALGQEIKTITLNEGNNYTYSLSDVPSGIYFANGSSARFKIMVTK
jgi:hypothetical protein